MALLPPYYNRELFSKHFLEQLLPQQPAWTAAAEAAAPVVATLRDLYRRIAPSATLREQQLEQKWIRPVLEALGVVFDVQVPLPTDNRAVTLAPDYALFGDGPAHQAARALLESGQMARYYDHVRMIGDAKRWGVNFGSAAKGQKTPRQQLTEYLHLTGVDWGFLTDGRQWRLVHRSVAGRLDQYYQVDLIECLESPNPDHFLYFYLFFSGDALRPGPAGAPCFLDAALRDSRDYAEEVGRDLKESVYEALRHLARGYLARTDVLELPPLATVQDECLALLYRLLFLLYAEHRRLLPLDDSRYGATYSLSALTHELAERLDQKAALGLHATTVWGRLASLFEMVDRGDPELDIPAYNGGLFAASDHPLLAAGGPGDRDLAAAIDLLARTASPPRHFIDYRDLDIRHLGSIYEGLLEYRLAVADTDLVAVKKDKRGGEHYVPFDPVEHAAIPPTARVTKGDTYLVTDRGERKVTGSFYTPDFIVEYIVDEALGPLVRGRSPAQIKALRVVDPAMGSGHFLLGAIDFLARAYGQARIDAGDDADGILSDDELEEYRRIVAEHCIFGVDVNPMAVELAKLALWLKTMARDRPLTFLDHHLRCGNSLLGASVAHLGERPPAAKAGKRKKKEAPSQQVDLFSRIFASRLPMMVDGVLQILARDTRTRNDIATKRACEAAVEEIRCPFTAVADTWLASLWNVAAGRAGRRARPAPHAGQAARPPRCRSGAPARHRQALLPLGDRVPRGVLRQGRPPPSRCRLRRRHRQPALDPPGIHRRRHSRPRPPLRQRLRRRRRHLRLLRRPRRGSAGACRTIGHGLLPNKWMRAEYGESLRRFLVEGLTPCALVDFGHAPVFPDADTFPCLLVTQRHVEGDPPEMRFASVDREQIETLDLHSHTQRWGYGVSVEQLPPEGWMPTPPEVFSLLEKIRRVGTPLKEAIGYAPLRGVLTGFNEAFLIDGETRRQLIAQDPGCAPLIRKFLRGSDLDRWNARWGGEWMIVLPSSENHPWPWAGANDPEASFAKHFPSLSAHMGKFRGPLNRRQDKGRYWWELRSCSYYDALTAPKVLYQEIAFHSQFALDLDGHAINNKVFLLPTGDSGVVGTLNSSLIWWYLWFTAPHMKDEAFALQSFYLETLPLIIVEPTVPTRLVNLAREQQTQEATFLGWLAQDIGVVKPSQRLQAFWTLSDADCFAEIKKAKVKLSAAATKRVADELERARAAMLPLLAESRRLEMDLHALVFRLYDLTEDEIELVRRTAPPRDPLNLITGTAQLTAES